MIDEKRLIREFLNLVQIDSESKNEKLIANYLKGKLQRLGLTVIEDKTMDVTGCTAGNLICTLPGTNKDVPVLYFTAHMDTVAPGKGVKPCIANGSITSDGTTILGADDKAGLAAIVEVIHVLKENNLEHGDIQFIMTVGEESALVGARALDVSHIHAQFGYALDYEGEVGTIVTAAPALAIMRVILSAQNARTHYGVEKGLSAIQIATQAIRKMTIGRIDGETMAKINRFAAIPDPSRVELVCEVYSMKDRKVSGQIEHMKTIFTETARFYGGRADVTVEHISPVLELAEESICIQLARQAAFQIGRIPRLSRSNDVSDANVFSARGIPTAVLGAGYERIHTTDEKIPVRELYKLAEMVLAIIEIVTRQYDALKGGDMNEG